MSKRHRRRARPAPHIVRSIHPKAQTGARRVERSLAEQPSPVRTSATATTPGKPDVIAAVTAILELLDAATEACDEGQWVKPLVFRKLAESAHRTVSSRASCAIGSRHARWLRASGGRP